MKTFMLIVLLLYAFYLTLEKYVITGRIFGTRQADRPQPSPDDSAQQTPPDTTDVVGPSRFQIGQSVNNGDYSRPDIKPEVQPANNDNIFTGQRQPPQSNSSSPQQFPQSKHEQAQSSLAPDLDGDVQFWKRQLMERIERAGSISESRTGTPPDPDNLPERDEVIGYVPRDPKRPKATGVMFDEMEAVHRVLEGDQPTPQQTQAQARDTFRRLEGTNMERILRASILGSSEKLQRYMNLYLSRPAPRSMTRTTKESILGLFDIEEFV